MKDDLQHALTRQDTKCQAINHNPVLVDKPPSTELSWVAPPKVKSHWFTILPH